MIIGLTGGIGSGKTAASNFFAALGVPIIDADVIAREVVLPGEKALDDIAHHFGSDILFDDGSLNRAMLREKIFLSEKDKHWLENLLHPLIRELTVNQLQAAQKTNAYVILASPLLLETDQHLLCQKIIVVDVPESLQLERSTSRDNNTIEQIKRIIASQITREERLERADYILDNSGTLEALEKQVVDMNQAIRSIL